MDKPSLGYTLYIAATAEQVWHALTDPQVLDKNWGKIESQWVVGAQVTECSRQGELLWQGTVLRSDAPHLLEYTFEVVGTAEPTIVTFELTPPSSKLAPNVQVTQLSLTQTGFAPNSEVLAGCLQALPEILSSIKTYVETGEPLGFVWNQ